MKWLSKTLCIITFFGWGCAFAQKVEIDRIDIRGNKIIVRYNLSDVDKKQKYSISLFSSYDKFAKPLTKVTGDVGPDVRPGDDRRITWNITSEIGDYKGPITFEIRGFVNTSFMELSESDIKTSYKPGKSYTLHWTSGNPSGLINIELYKGNELIIRRSNLPNTGSFDWLFNERAKSGKGYRLKFVNSNDPEEFIYSNTFFIKSKSPLMLKVGAVALVGVGVAILVGGGGGGGGDSNNSTKLPEPPATPGG
jgi:hypothetical protein